MNSVQNSKLNHGQGLVEYALLLGLVAIVVTASLVLMGPSIGDMFNKVATEFESGMPPAQEIADAPAGADETGPTFADLSAAVASCVTNNGARNSLSNAASNENLSTFNTLLEAHHHQLTDACYHELSSMAASMA